MEDLTRMTSLIDLVRDPIVQKLFDQPIQTNSFGKGSVEKTGTADKAPLGGINTTDTNTAGKRSLRNIKDQALDDQSATTCAAPILTSKPTTEPQRIQWLYNLKSGKFEAIPREPKSTTTSLNTAPSASMYEFAYASTLSDEMSYLKTNWDHLIRQEIDKVAWEKHPPLPDADLIDIGRSIDLTVVSGKKMLYCQTTLKTMVLCEEGVHVFNADFVNEEFWGNKWVDVHAHLLGYGVEKYEDGEMEWKKAEHERARREKEMPELEKW